MKLTGNTRYRTTLFGKLVLQVEEHRVNYDNLGGSGCYTGNTKYTSKHWRDANVKDLECQINSAVE